MNAWLRTSARAVAVAGVAVLLASCGSSGLDAAAGRSAAAKAQASVRTAYDALVAALGGEPIAGRGSFVNCGLGNNSLRWTFRGSLRGASGTDLVTRAGQALTGAGFRPSAAGDTDRSRAHLERDGLAVVLDEDTVNAGWLGLVAETPCAQYDTSSADALKSTAAWTYGAPLG